MFPTGTLVQRVALSSNTQYNPLDKVILFQKQTFLSLTRTPSGPASFTFTSREFPAGGAGKIISQGRIWIEELALNSPTGIRLTLWYDSFTPVFGGTRFAGRYRRSEGTDIEEGTFEGVTSSTVREGSPYPTEPKALRLPVASANVTTVQSFHCDENKEHHGIDLGYSAQEAATSKLKPLPIASPCTGTITGIVRAWQVGSIAPGGTEASQAAMLGLAIHYATNYWVLLGFESFFDASTGGYAQAMGEQEALMNGRVVVGAWVNSGDLLGNVRTAGPKDEKVGGGGPHLHWEIVAMPKYYPQGPVAYEPARARSVCPIHLLRNPDPIELGKLEYWAQGPLCEASVCLLEPFEQMPFEAI